MRARQEFFCMAKFTSYREYLEKQDKRVVLVFALAAVGFIIFSAVLVTLPFKDTLFGFLFPKPQSFANTNMRELKEAKFYSNELLIKVKKTSRGKVKENLKQTGLAAVDRVGGFQKLKKFEKVARPNKKSKEDADIFSWYHVVFDSPSNIISGTFDVQSQTIASDHQSGKLLRQLMAEMRNDPDIEAIEPNFVVSTTQTGCETQMALSVAQPNVTVAPGQQYTNTLSIKNNGTTTCGPINISATFPGGWSQILNPGTVTVAPGQTATSAVTVNVYNGTASGTYNHYLWLGSYGAGSVGIAVQVSGTAVSPVASPTTAITATVAPTSLPATGSAVPNDPYYASSGSWGQNYPDLWGLKKINMESAWQQTRGSTSVIVADIDTGVDRNHPDIAGNMWVNTAEIQGNGIDDDANGYIDDYYGWDFLNNDSDPMDDHGHGTHTVGTIAASGNNNLGVVGVNWNSKVMALKFLGANGSGSSVGAVRALQYAADMGARVSSNSWGCDCVTTYFYDAIRYEHERGMVVVVAAGNTISDAIENSPAGLDRVITVAASDASDRKAGFSNGGERIDVAAPGVDILSARATNNPMCTADKTVGGTYCRVSGTSMATPHVAGLAALLLAKNPALTNEEVRQIIRTSADDLGTAGKDNDFGYGRVNAGKTISNAFIKPLTPFITSPLSRTTAYGSALTIIGSIGGENFASYKVEMGNGRTVSEWKEIQNSTTQVNNGTLATVQIHTLPEGYNIFRVTATTTDGRSYQYQVNDIFVDNVESTLLNPVQHSSKGNIQIKGTAITKNGLAFTSYRLEWGLGTSPSNWSTEGITLVNNGQQPVQNNILGTWDTTGLMDGKTYSLRLVTTGANGVSVPDSKVTLIDQDLAQGWPMQFVAPQGYAADPVIPVLVDLEGDGTKEVVVTDLSNGIWAYRKDGSVVPGFPFRAGYGEVFDWHVNAVDLDNDGTTELIGVAQKVGSMNSRIYIVKSNGTAYAGWPTVILNLSAIFSDGVPAITDLDKNGTLDLITVDRDPINPKIARLHAFNLNGTELSGFPKLHTYLENVQWNGAVVLADLDKDGNTEIAYGNDRKMYLYDNTGTLLPGWPYEAPLFNGTIPMFQNSAAAGDIDGNGSLELITVAAERYCSNCNVQLFAFRKDGSIVTGFPLSSGLYYYEPYIRHHTTSLADIDGDGKDEIFAGLQTIAIFDETTKQILKNPVNADTQVAIADADGDGFVDMAAGWKNELNITKLDGTPIFKKLLSTTQRGVHAPVLADLDINGKADVSMTYFLTEYINNVVRDSSTVYLYELPSTNTNGTIAGWPMFSANAARTGRVNVERIIPTAVPVTQTVTPLPTNTPTQVPTNTPVPTATPTRVPTSTPVPETTPPSVTITSPVNNATVKKSSNTTINAIATDVSGIAKVEFYVNNVLTCTDTVAPYTCAWKVPSKARVLYTLQAKAFDTRGNSATHFVQVTSK